MLQWCENVCRFLWKKKKKKSFQTKGCFPISEGRCCLFCSCHVIKHFFQNVYVFILKHFMKQQLETMQLMFFFFPPASGFAVLNHVIHCCDAICKVRIRSTCFGTADVLIKKFCHHLKMRWLHTLTEIAFFFLQFIVQPKNTYFHISCPSVRWLNSQTSREGRCRRRSRRLHQTPWESRSAPVKTGHEAISTLLFYFIILFY